MGRVNDTEIKEEGKIERNKEREKIRKWEIKREEEIEEVFNKERKRERESVKWRGK